MKAKKEQVAAYERKRDVTTVEKCFRKTLQTIAADYKIIPVQSSKTCFVYDQEE